MIFFTMLNTYKNLNLDYGPDKQLENSNIYIFKIIFEVLKKILAVVSFVVALDRKMVRVSEQSHEE